MIMNATYHRQDGSAPEKIDDLPALFKRLGSRVAADYFDELDADGEMVAEIWEVYGEGETCDDHPDGDPHADYIRVLVDA